MLWAALALQAPSADAETNVDHAGVIRSWNSESFARGQKLYSSFCQPCHGTLSRPGSLPASRAFWKEPFKNGADPLSLYKTITHGLGEMPGWPFVPPEQRYDVIHYIREAFIRSNNPPAYFKVTPSYLAGLPEPKGEFRKTPEMIEFEKGPKYPRMDFGPVLFWTFEAAKDNIAYKGIAVRLDDGPGGVSKGRIWMLYDHDTMRVAAGWTGDRFVDWKGIAFDGSHGTHTSILGERAFINPVGPGWANPETGRFDDPRLRGRDGKPYGPLPREWSHFKGVYLHSNKVVIAYTVGDAEILESPGCETNHGHIAFLRTLNIGKSSRDLLMRVSPLDLAVSLTGPTKVRVIEKESFRLLSIPADTTPVKLTVRLRSSETTDSASVDLATLTNGGPLRWSRTFLTHGKVGSDDVPFAVDEIPAPADHDNPWQTWMRFSGFDFFEDGQRAALCTWNGDVWLVSGLDDDLPKLRWKRIASGLFQPLGVKIVKGVIYVGCRDQIARLHDFNADGEIDFIENFNNDHQVTEHFHEFAMGLQTDREGNFYYAKSARHAKLPVVPHHGTLLKVSKDGSSTEIVASGFRAANGVCVNDDGTFFVTDQEGHWIPKNRINWVQPGKFYGNMWAYNAPDSTADDAMEPPLVWITNQKDRSPGELVRVTSDGWPSLKGSLLNISYGMGRVFVVPYEKAGEQLQGGVVELPIPDFPTGTMRGRFNPRDGHLYVCGMFAWAGNRTRDGGFYRIRATGRAMYLPVGLHANSTGVELTFTDALDVNAAQDVKNYAVKIWSIKRTANYGSDHFNEQVLQVTNATLSADGKTVQLAISDIRPTWCMEIQCNLRVKNGAAFTRNIHNTIHALRPHQRTVSK